MSIHQFEYHPEAILEASEAFQWYRERSPRAADGFLAELQRARIAVTENPRLWPLYFEETRCCRFNRFPYGLVFVEENEKIVGLAVVHFRRRPGYWRDRLQH